MLHDVSARVGGLGVPVAQQVEMMILIHAGDVVGDNLWLPIPLGGSVSRSTMSRSLPALPSVPSHQFYDTGNYESDDYASGSCEHEEPNADAPDGPGGCENNTEVLQVGEREDQFVESQVHSELQSRIVSYRRSLHVREVQQE